MKYSIWHIYIFLFSAIIFASLIIVTGISLYFYKFNIDRIIEERITNIQTIANTISSPFWIHQELMHIPGTIENFLYEMSKIKEIVFVRTVNETNSKIEKSSDKKDLGEKVENLPIFNENVYIRDGYFKGKKIKEITLKSKGGENLWIGVSFDEIKKKTLFGTILLGESLFILLSLAALAVFYISRKFILNPLIILIESFDEIKKKNYKNAYIEEFKDVPLEMKNVFDSYNTAISEMELSEEKLKKSNWEHIKDMETKIKNLEDQIYDLEKSKNNIEEKLKNYL